MAGPQSKIDSSPRATGPAGAQFEAKVATHYALALLANTEPVGLPGVVVDRLEFQMKGLGYPLDDVIVFGTTPQGENRCLEIQVKRSMAFTKKNPKFASIVERIVSARKTVIDRRFAVAIERTTGAIENGVQEALELAQQTIDAESFMIRLEKTGRGNKQMCSFVKAFKEHLATNGETEDHTLYDVLRSFSVLYFDYARPNSIVEHCDRIRAQQLASDNSDTNPYDALFGFVLSSDAIGGNLNRSELVSKLNVHGVRFGSAPRLARARSQIQEMSRHALGDIELTVNGAHLAREKLRRDLEALIQVEEVSGGIVEISGPSGAGKSGLMRMAIEARELASRIVVLSPYRATAGGWSQMRTDYRIEATAEEFLNDLACDGGGYLCIDGLDQFRNESKRKTLIDLLRAALNCPGVVVLFTARSGWEERGSLWIGEEILQQLSSRQCLTMEGLDDDESEALAKQVPQLAPLLSPNHPAKALTRNPMKLRILSRTRLKSAEVISEAALAKEWKDIGAVMDERPTGKIRSRKRVLHVVANGLINNVDPVDVSEQESQVVAGLIEDGVLIETSTDQVLFRHDLFTDWAVACVLSENPSMIDKLALDKPPQYWMERGFDLACRMLAESGSDKAFLKLLVRLETEGVSSGWAELALLALIRSELADTLMVRFESLLLEDEGRRGAQLIRRFVATHSKLATHLFKKILPEEIVVPEGMTIPSGPGWIVMLLWCLERFDKLGVRALSAAVDIFMNWLEIEFYSEENVTPILLDRFADILVADIETREGTPPRYGDPLPKIKHAVSGDALKKARHYFALFAPSSPAAAARYLNAVKHSKRPEETMSQILEFPGKLHIAAPAEFASTFLCAIEDHDEEVENRTRTKSRYSHAMSFIDSPFVLGHSGIRLFTEILQAAPATGAEFIRTLIKRACVLNEDNPYFLVQLLGETRRIESPSSYGWSRGGAPSAMLIKALAAIEYWAHRRLDDGEALEDVIRDVIGVGPIHGALWLVTVDLVLSHSSLNGAVLRDLLTSPETLALDAVRAIHDEVNRMVGGFPRHALRVGPEADKAVDEDLAGRASRSIALHNVITPLVFKLSVEDLGTLHEKLDAAACRLGRWTHDTVEWGSPEFMASHALRLASRENYELITAKNSAGKVSGGWVYKFPPVQKRWMEEKKAIASTEHSKMARWCSVRFAMKNETMDINVGAAEAKTILDETATVVPGNYDETLREPNDQWLARISAAAFLVRVGSPEEVALRKPEITSIFNQALESRDQYKGLPHNDIMYNPLAMAIAGRLYLAVASGEEEDAEPLVQSVVEFPASAASAFLGHGSAVKKIDEKLLVSLSRLALLACRFPRKDYTGENTAAYQSRRESLESCLAFKIKAERRWREGGAEPDWSIPPSRRPRNPKRTLPLGWVSGDEKHPSHEPEWYDYYFDGITAAAWLRILQHLDSNAGSTSQNVLRANRSWLLETNKPVDGEDDRDIERDWTRGLMRFAAAHARDWSDGLLMELIVNLLKAFSDEAFIYAASEFIVQSDLHLIEGEPEDRAYLLSVRVAFWQRLKKTQHWRRHLLSSSDGIEIRLKELVSAFYMHMSQEFGVGQSYTKGLSDPELRLFLPLLSEIACDAKSCPTIALLYLNVLECLDPSTAEEPLAAVAEQWAKAANNRFWNEFGIGNRVLTIGSKVVTLTNRAAWSAVCNALLAAGVTVGTDFKNRLQD